MDRRKVANQQVKDRLLDALLELAQEKDLSQVKVTELVARSGVARASFYRNFTSVEDIVDYGIQRMARLYHEGMPADAAPRSREAVLYQFRFYREHAPIVLAFHRAHAATTLLDVLTECKIAEAGDMPARKRYELYYFAGAFYNMLVCWLESGMQETPEAMADEFLRIAAGSTSRESALRPPNALPRVQLYAKRSPACAPGVTEYTSSTWMKHTPLLV